jgi:hypothetical protein
VNDACCPAEKACESEVGTLCCGDGEVCNQDVGACQRDTNCATSLDCDPEYVCCNGQCVFGNCCDVDDCLSDSDGQGGLFCCANTCTNVIDNEFACGSCNNPCASGETCCVDTCVDTASDPDNCGACGQECGFYRGDSSGQACTCERGTCCDPQTCGDGAQCDGVAG